MKNIIFLALSCLSMANAYALTEFESRSLRNQEMILQEQRQENNARACKELRRGTTRMGGY